MSDLLIIVRPDVDTLKAFDAYCRANKIDRQTALLDYMKLTAKKAARKKLPVLRNKTGNDPK